jgi:hypothetical protein
MNKGCLVRLRATIWAISPRDAIIPLWNSWTHGNSLITSNFPIKDFAIIISEPIETRGIVGVNVITSTGKSGWLPAGQLEIVK